MVEDHLGASDVICIADMVKEIQTLGPAFNDVIKFLRAREIVHYQRFAEAVGIAQDTFSQKCNFYQYNPAFDRPGNSKC